MKKPKVLMFKFFLMVISGLICFSAGAALAVCPDGISAYWNLDEAAGPYSDAMGLNDGVGNVAAPTATTEGRVAGAQVFVEADGTGIDVVESHTFSWLNTDSFSVELWVKTPGAVVRGTQVFIGREEGASGMQWWIGVNADGEASYLIQDETGGSTLAKIGVGPDLTDDDWHHLVLVRDAISGTNSFYVDNALIDETVQNFPAGLASATANLNIGWLDTAGNAFRLDGVIDEVALYDRALTVDEVDDHFVAGNSGIDVCGGSFSIDAPYPENTAAFWNLDEAAGPYSDAMGLNDGVGNVAAPTATTEGRVAGAQVFVEADGTGIDVVESHTFSWLNTDSFSVELWVKTPGAVVRGTQVFIGREEGASGMQWWIGVNADGEASYLIQDETGGSTLAKIGVGPDLTDDDWHHLVLVRDAISGTNSFYVDNALIDETVQNFPAGLASATANLNIGWLDTAGNAFRLDGVIDEVALYDRALTVDEIDDHFVAGSAGLSVTSLRPEPVADAGDNQSVSAGADVTLDGTGSSGTTLTYQWEQLDGTAVTLSGATTDTATFTAPATSSVLTLTFRLTVTDNDGFSSTDDTSVTVNPASSVVPPPTGGGDGGGGGGCFISSIF